MKKIFVFITCVSWGIACIAQNVGIGTTTPGFPLNFANTTGDKISLYGNTGSHFGFGIQSSLLQIHTDAAISNIAFGYGSSNNFTERMRILNSLGYDGMILNGRLVLKNGSSDLVGGGAGVWLYKADNSALLGFMGTQNNQNIGFYGGTSGWGFTYDAINSRVGIGNTSPVNRLDVAGLNNWDLANTEGDMRVGNSSYRLKFGVALAGGGAGSSTIMQYGQPGGFNNLGLGSQGKTYININGGGDYIDITNASGGIRLNGNAGSAGQVLQSNGNSAAPTWTSIIKPYVISYTYSLSTSTYLTGAGVLSAPIQGLDNQTFTLQQSSSIVFMANLNFTGDVYTASYGYLSIKILNNLNQVVASGTTWGQALADFRHTTITAFLSANIPAGFYRTQVLLVRNTDSDGNFTIGGAAAVLQIFPN
jgi:hypothetical protein